MNFKYLFGALALPALVASCTNEDIVLENNDSQLANRRVVGNVILDASKALDGVNSRWAGAGFVAGEDIIGACLMDAPGTGGMVPTSYISTNYKFSYNEEGQWVSDALFVEGSYYFYMQYNKNMRNRAGLVDTIPAIQYVGESGNDAILANQLFLGHYDITVDHKDLTVPVQLHEVYARPKFSFAYDGTSNVTIEKVVFSNSAFKLARQLNSTTGLGTSYTAYTGATPVTGNSDVYFDAFQDAMAAGKTVNSIKAIVPQMMEGQGSAATITLVPAKEAASISGAILIPATAYGADLSMKVYTNKGIVETSIPAFVSTERPVQAYATTLAQPIVPSEYVKVDATKMPAELYGGWGGSTNVISVSFKDNAITVPATLDVNTIEELEKYLTSWYAGKKKTIEELAVNLGADITLNANVAAFLANTTTNPVVTFAGAKTITIPSGLAATVLNTINAGNCGVAIAEGAEQILNVGANKTFGTITNNGTLTIAGDGSDLTSEVYRVGTLNNNGTLTVNYSSNIADIWNMGTITVNQALAETLLRNGANNVGTRTYSNAAKAVVKADVKQINNFAVTEFDGTVATVLYNLNANVGNTAVPDYICGNAVVKGGELTVSEGRNLGVIDVTDGSMLLTGAYENMPGVTDKYDAGLINIAAGKMLSTQAVLTNNGDVYNNGYFAAANGVGEIKNYGNLNHGANALTLISTNEDGGKVVLNEPNPSKLTIKTEKTGSIVEYTTVDTDFTSGESTAANNDKLKTLDTRITNLIVTKTGDAKLNNLGENVVDLTINSADGNVTFAEGRSLTNLTVKGGEHTIGSVIVTEDLTIESGEIVTIPSGATITYNGDEAQNNVFTNKGTIYVVGTLSATAYLSTSVVGKNGNDGAATIYNTGASGNVSWE